MAAVALGVIVIATLQSSSGVDARWAAQNGEPSQPPEAAAYEAVATQMIIADHHIDTPPAMLHIARSLATGETLEEDDDVSPSCRRVCVRYKYEPIYICGADGCRLRGYKEVCCAWELRDCYYG